MDTKIDIYCEACGRLLAQLTWESLIIKSDYFIDCPECGHSQLINRYVK